MKRLLFIVPLVALIGVIAAFASGLTRNPAELPSTLIDRPLPPLALEPVREGGTGLTTAALKGEPALLNVFASWCAPCRVEHPMLMQLARQGVPLYGLNWKDSREAGARWLAEHGDPFRAVGSDADGRAGIELGVTGAPETFVVDASGRVRYRHLGPITPQVWEETLRPMLARLSAGA